MNKKTLFIGGKFNDDEGKHSKIAEIVSKELNYIDLYKNGGSFNELESIVDNIDDFNLIYWFPDIPNDKEKLVKNIKQKNKACVLVTSKRNTEEKYTFEDVMHHALNNKSNLIVEVGERDNRYNARIFDPLGNLFLDFNHDFRKIGEVIDSRGRELTNYTRIQSRQVGNKLPVPNEREFFKIVRFYAESFHTLTHIHPRNVNRFMGNASFKEMDEVYISNRNLDKRNLDESGFVRVKPNLSRDNKVEYYGDIKPSVDTPIQLKLFEHYKQINFMLHSHAYIKDAPFTDGVIPCGALEEANAIIDKFSNQWLNEFYINLRGHGSLALVDKTDKLLNPVYIARKMPEDPFKCE